MERINRILTHPLFLEEVKALEVLEADRIYCRHGIDHLLAVARIAWIRVLEENFLIDKELVYAAALLHDIGRAAQYRTGEPHEEAGVLIAGQILSDLSFEEPEIEEVQRVIAGHRMSAGPRDMHLLGELIYRADKASRDCYICSAKDTCKWSEDEKNSKIER